jgi:hypothetical protein
MYSHKRNQKERPEPPNQRGGRPDARKMPMKRVKLLPVRVPFGCFVEPSA